MSIYQRGKIYQLVCLTTGQKYVGSTTQKTLAERLAGHNRKFKCWKNGTYHFVTSFTILEQGNYQIELLESCPCNSKDELNAREGHYIRTIDCVNKCIAGRTHKEYYQENKTIIAEKYKAYCDTHKTEIAEQRKAFREKNKIEIAERHKVYREDNKVELAEKHKEYYDTNKAELLANKKEYYEANKTLIAEKGKAFREANKEAINQRRREIRQLKKSENAS